VCLVLRICYPQRNTQFSRGRFLLFEHFLNCTHIIRSEFVIEVHN
jgi:hypothetical protein